LNRKEGFENAAFFESKKNYFHYQQPPSGYRIVNPGIPGPSAEIDRAFITKGYSSDPSSIANGITKFFYTAVNEQNDMDQKCKSVGKPSQLKGTSAFMADRARKGEGCGWWYVDNLYMPSTGAYGTAPTINEYGVQVATGGPQDASIPALYPGGEWIWDLEEAEKREHIKRCKRIQNCDLIDGVDECAFCPSKGYAVPITSEKTLKYPNDDEANCGDSTSLVSSGKSCPPLVIQPRLQNYDYDYDRNGNVVQGENSRALAQVGQTLEFVCSASPLSKECRLAMCKELAGCTEGRGLHRIVQQDGTLTETDRLALQYLSSRGSLGIPTTFTETGTIPKTDAMDLMKRIRDMAMSSQSGIAKAAARWLVDETPFDVCLYAEGDTGPFPLECIQREFRKAGCQASGSRYPKDATQFAGMSFGTLKTQFRDLYAQMTDTNRMANVRDQDRAVQDCLGISVVRSTDETWARNPNLCRDPGVEYWVYSIPTVGQVILLGRMVVPEFLISSDATLATKKLQALLQSAPGYRGFTARTYVDIGPTETTVTLSLPTNDLYDNYSVSVNGQKATRLSNIPLVPQQRNLIELRFEAPKGVDFGDPALTVSPTSRLVLNQSAWKPFVALEAQVGKNVFADTNQYLDIESVDVGRFGERDGLVIPQTPMAFVLRRGLAYQAIQTVTCMFYWKSLAGQSTIFQLDQGRGGVSDTVLAFRIVDKFPTFLLQSSKGLYQFRAPTPLGSPNQWVHVAIVLGATVQVWINGVEVRDPVKKQGGTGTMYTRLVFGSPGFDGGIGWFHVYDRKLTVSEITRDRRYDDASLTDKDSQVDSALAMSPIAGPGLVMSPIAGPEVARSPIAGPGLVMSPIAGPAPVGSR
jgi:hypothetical protein